MSEKHVQGWARPGAALKFHYFPSDGNDSLCGRWWFTGLAREDENHDSPDNCASCERARQKRAGKKGTATP